MFPELQIQPRRVGRSAAALLCSFLLTHVEVHADYKTDIGFSKLQAELGGAMPTGEGVTVTQVEAPEAANSYQVDATNAEFAGKTLTAQEAPPATRTQAGSTISDSVPASHPESRRSMFTKRKTGSKLAG